MIGKGLVECRCKRADRASGLLIESLCGKLLMSVA